MGLTSLISGVMAFCITDFPVGISWYERYLQSEPYSIVAPPRRSISFDPESAFILTPERLAFVRSHLLYWHFERGPNNESGDLQNAIETNNPVAQKHLYASWPILGSQYKNLKISLHGILEFSNTADSQETNISIITIFNSINDISRFSPHFNHLGQKSGTYFRYERGLDLRTDQFGVELRERTMWDIREGFPGAETFMPKHVMIITWKSMEKYMEDLSHCGIRIRPVGRSNTFQIVLATNCMQTYAIFNYADLNWFNHPDALLRPVSSFINYNPVDGSWSQRIPRCHSQGWRQLLSNGLCNGFPGRHIYRIDENILVSDFSNN